MHSPFGEAIGQPLVAPFCEASSVAVRASLFTSLGEAPFAPFLEPLLSAFSNAPVVPVLQPLFASFGQASLATVGETVLTPLREAFRAARGAAFVHTLGTARRETLGAPGGPCALLGRAELDGQARRGRLVSRGARFDSRPRDGGLALGVGFGLRLSDGCRQFAGKLVPQPVSQRVDGFAQMVLDGHA